MSQVCEFYELLLAKKDVEAISCRADSLKSKLQKHFGDVLLFAEAKQHRGSMLAFANVAKGHSAEALVHAAAAQAEDADEAPVTLSSLADSIASSGRSTRTAVQDLYHAALIVRQTLTSVDNFMSWPPTVEDFTEGIEEDSDDPGCVVQLPGMGS